MAVDLRCPNCADNLGKETENYVVAWCGTCGTKFFNEEGDWDELDDEDKKWLKDNNHKKRKSGGYYRFHGRRY